MDKNKRIFLFDNLKFFLILTVVVGHFADQAIEYRTFKSLYFFIYTFHMPLFLFVSGLFHRNRDIVKKAVIYISLGYFLKAFLFFTKIGLGKHPKFSLLAEDGVPWFMFALAAFTVLSYVLRDINKKYVLFLAVFIACLAGYDKSIGDFLCLSRIIVFFPFYHLGTMIDKEKLLSLNHSSRHKLLGICIFTAGALICIFLLNQVYTLRPLFTGRNPFRTEWYPFGGILRLFYYAASLSIGYALICITPDKPIPLITNFGKRTLQVYFWHRPVLCVLSELGLPQICVSISGKFVYLAIAVLLTFILSFRIFGFPTEHLMALKNNQTRP